jgi:hypothetical protein
MSKEMDAQVPGAESVRPVDARSGQGVQVGQGGVQVNFFAEPPVPRGDVTTWPVVSGRPPLLATAFQTRPQLLARLDAVLEPSASGLDVTVVLSGDGGVGKTQLAAGVYDRAIAERCCDLYVWVTAASSPAVTAGFARAWERAHDARPGGDPELNAQRFLEWLRETDRRWLIVLDDLPDPAVMREWWPAGRAGRTVVTSRRRDAVLSDHQRVVLDVGVFQPAESAAYLTARLSTSTARPDDLTAAASLATALGHLPLALSQAAAVILDDGTTCAQYLTRFSDRATSLDEAFPASADEQARTVAATWSLAVHAADQLPPRGCSRPLLSLIAALDPNGIPEAVLTSPAAAAHVQSIIGTSPIPGGPIGSGGLRSTLRTLHRLSLISHHPGDPVRSVRMHALAQRATMEGLTSSVRQTAHRAAADALVEVWPEVERDTHLGSVLRSNADALTDRAADALWTPGTHPLIFRAGSSLGQAGLVTAAVSFWIQAQRTCARVLGPDHVDTLATRHNLAYWRGHAGDPQAAADAFEQLLTDRLRVLGLDHPHTPSTRHELARWRREAGDIDGATTAAEQALADHLRVFGPDHPNTLVARYNSANCLGEGGDPAAAVLALETLITDRQRILGPDHPSTLTTRQALARWRGQAGDPPAAIDVLQDLLADQLRVLGSDHPATLTTRHGIAHWHGQAADPDRAATMLQDLLPDQVRVLGPDHPATKATQHNLAYWTARRHPPAATAAPEEPPRDNLAPRECIPYWKQTGQ